MVTTVKRNGSDFMLVGRQIITIISVTILFTGLLVRADWQWENPLPQGNSIKGMSALSGSDIFAVGDQG